MTRSLLGMAVMGCALGLLASQALAAEPGPLDRTILPIQEPARPLYKEIDARNVTDAAALRGQGARRARPTSSSC